MAKRGINKIRRLSTLACDYQSSQRESSGNNKQVSRPTVEKSHQKAANLNFRKIQMFKETLRVKESTRYSKFGSDSLTAMNTETVY